MKKCRMLGNRLIEDKVRAARAKDGWSEAKAKAMY